MVLDMARLGKQRVEAYQLVNAIERKQGWSNHPAAVMFRQYVPALKLYGWLACETWIERGCKDSLQDLFVTPETVVMPWWIGGPIHETHRSNLVRKYPGFYGNIFTEDPTLAYYWPTELPS